MASIKTETLERVEIGDARDVNQALIPAEVQSFEVPALTDGLAKVFQVRVPVIKNQSFQHVRHFFYCCDLF